jgi:threonine/homoserine/homoserine lactone efflux protein
LSPAPALGRIARDGFVVALLNPKTALFFAAFLPQFLDPAAPALVPTLRLGACFVAIAAGTDAFYVLAASAAARMFAGRARASAWARRAGGLVFIGLGVAAAWTSSRPTR